MTVMTRKELHDLIWTEPAQRLAKKFGISDRGLGKLCTRHEIPVPPRGYWARVAAGQPAKRRQLLKATKPGLETVRIHATAPPPPEVLALKEEFQRLRQSAPNSRSEPALKIEDFVEKPHRSIARTAAALRKAKPDRDGGISAMGEGMCGVVIHSDRREKVISILHGLAVTLAPDDLSIEPTGSLMKLRRGEDSISFTLSEKYHREKHRPTLDEQAKYDQLVAKEKKRQGGAFFWPPKEPWPEFDRVYDNKLVLKIDAWGEGVRKSWSDGVNQSLERMTDVLVEGLKLALAAEKVRREEQEQRAIRAAELERRRDLARRRKKREEQRIEHVRRIVALRKEADETQAWLDSTTNNAAAEHSPSADRMLEWVKERLNYLRNQMTALSATVAIDGTELFPEIDELLDPQGDPPEPTRYW